MANEAQKKQINIALVGIRPADQITLKGYMRVLLSLDAELRWLSATDSNIHLFMINQEFKSANSVSKLLAANKTAAVLFIDRVEVGDGSLTQNRLVLPLKQISQLHDWLVRHIPALSESTEPKIQAEPEEIAEESVEEGISAGFIDLITTYQSRVDGCFELMEGDRPIAIIDNRRQLIWAGESSVLSQDWYLRPYEGNLPGIGRSKDASDWLWRMALQNPKPLLALLHSAQTYQVRYWAKPPMNDMRRDLVAVMTAIESRPLSVADAAAQAHVSVATAQKTIASLLFSGNLMPNAYHNLGNKAPTVSAPAPAPAAPTPRAVEVVDSSEKQEKMSFLSRLRKKLGL